MSVYLDNAATTRPYPELAERCRELAGDLYGNASSVHGMGIAAEKLIVKSRDILSQILRCSSSELIFTSGGTESNNIALLGAARANKRRGKRIVTTAIEHPSVIEPMKKLVEEGFELCVVGVSENGTIHYDELEDLINDDTILVSISHVNNETGNIQDLARIGRIVKKKSAALFHSDGVQGFCKEQIHLNASQTDLYSFSAHKFHGMKGSGGLFVRKGSKLSPILYGGGDMIRPGTANPAGIYTMALAAEIANKNASVNSNTVSELRERLLQACEALPFARLNGVRGHADVSPYILNMSFIGIKSEVLLQALSEQDIFVSAGSACNKRKGQASPVLSSMGLSKDRLDSALRFSFSHDNTVEQIKYCKNKLTELTANLLAITKPK